MMTAHSFKVIGEPKGQPRPKAFARKMGAKTVARVFDPGTAEAWKGAIALAVKDAGVLGLMLEGPLALEMTCYFSRPGSHFGTRKGAKVLKPSAESWHIKKPDMDNIVKAAKDALTHLGVWRDDSQVCREVLEKRYAMGSGASVTFFKIWRLE